MSIPIFQIDAFTDTLFGGNPAAVCPLNEWLADDILLQIAKENNLAETAYFTQLDTDTFHLRWFTPDIEMDLCGHATLATAHCIFTEIVDKHVSTIHFQSKSGSLRVRREADRYVMQLPRREGQKTTLPTAISQAINIQPDAVLKARDYLLIYPSEKDILNMKINRPLFDSINLGTGGMIVSAPGTDCDFVSRFFTPQATILEDPVTGSAHCTLIPYWRNILNKQTMQAKQLSERGGQLMCFDFENHVEIAGKAITFLKGSMYL